MQVCLPTIVTLTLTLTMRETNGEWDQVILQLFESDTEDEDFDGFVAQEEDEDSELESAPVPCNGKNYCKNMTF